MSPHHRSKRGNKLLKDLRFPQSGNQTARARARGEVSPTRERSKKWPILVIPPTLLPITEELVAENLQVNEKKYRSIVTLSLLRDALRLHATHTTLYAATRIALLNSGWAWERPVMSEHVAPERNETLWCGSGGRLGDTQELLETVALRHLTPVIREREGLVRARSLAHFVVTMATRGEPAERFATEVFHAFCEVYNITVNKFKRGFTADDCRLLWRYLKSHTSAWGLLLKHFLRSALVVGPASRLSRHILLSTHFAQPLILAHELVKTLFRHRAAYILGDMKAINSLNTILSFRELTKNNPWSMYDLTIELSCYDLVPHANFLILLLYLVGRTTTDRDKVLLLSSILERYMGNVTTRALMNAELHFRHLSGHQQEAILGDRLWRDSVARLCRVSLPPPSTAQRARSKTPKKQTTEYL